VWSCGRRITNFSMMIWTDLSRAAQRTVTPRRRRRLPQRRAISVVLVVIVMVVLIAFASLAVDVGRVRLAKVQLQTAADSAATAAVSGMQLFPQRGVLEPQERAVDAASRNHTIDQADSGDGGARSDSGVELFVDEDMVFGRWFDESREFVRIEQSGGGVDDRRQADAIRVWTRRVTQFEDPDGNIVQRGNALPLIFAPVIGVEKGEVWARATATLNGHVNTAAFVGLQYVRFQGATRSDSYIAGSENYPGSGGANRNSSIASNGEVSFNGAATIWGSVHPGINQWIMPQPLSGNIDITGYMFPLSKVMTAATPAFTPPPIGQANEPTTIDPPEAVQQPNNDFAPNKAAKLISLPKNKNASTHFVFASWVSHANDVITIDNSKSPIEIWISGNFSHSGKARIDITSPLHPVTFHVNGEMDVLGNGIVAASDRPSDLQIQMTRPGSRLRIGGSQALFAHVVAPVSDVVYTGNGKAQYHFYGRAVGKTLTVASNVELHYDESLGTATDPKFQIRLVE
jgi:hypothetical protein